MTLFDMLIFGSIYLFIGNFVALKTSMSRHIVADSFLVTAARYFLMVIFWPIAICILTD